MDRKKITELVTQAENLEKKRGFLEYLSSSMSTDKYETISDLYEKAANLSRFYNTNESISYYVKSYECATKIQNEFSEKKIKKLLEIIGDLYVEINLDKSIEYYLRLINIHMKQGNISQMCRLYEQIANVYLNNKYLEQAHDTLEKIISIGSTDSESFFLVNKAKYSLGSVCIQQANYLKAGEIFWSIGIQDLGHRIFAYGAKKYFFTSIICVCAANNIVKARELFLQACGQDHSFEKSFQGKFIPKLLASIESVNIETLELIYVSFNQIIPLDNDQEHLLLQIKTNLEDTLNQNIDLS